MNAVTQTLALSRRAIVGLMRQPAVVVPSVFFPLFFTALNSAAFERATNLPQFPAVDSFLDFLLPATILQGVIFGATSAGVEMATDVSNGFFDRLLASPVSRTSILVGRLAGGAVLGACQALLFVAVLTAFGADVHGGPLALLVLVLVAMLLGVGIGGFGVAMALRTGSAEAVQGSFPLLFVLIFTSSAFFPRELMSGWYQDLAGANPVSWMVEGLRTLVIDDFAVRPAARAIAIAGSLCVLTVALSLRMLRMRIREAL